MLYHTKLKPGSIVIPSAIIRDAYNSDVVNSNCLLWFSVTIDFDGLLWFKDRIFGIINPIDYNVYFNFRIEAEKLPQIFNTFGDELLIMDVGIEEVTFRLYDPSHDNKNKIVVDIRHKYPLFDMRIDSEVYYDQLIFYKPAKEPINPSLLPIVDKLINRLADHLARQNEEPKDYQILSVRRIKNGKWITLSEGILSGVRQIKNGKFITLSEEKMKEISDASLSLARQNEEPKDYQILSVRRIKNGKWITLSEGILSERPILSEEKMKGRSDARIQATNNLYLFQIYRKASIEHLKSRLSDVKRYKKELNRQRKN